MSDARIRVAIVDDDESVRKALSRLLRSAGLDAESFGSGEEFLRSLSHHRPDCLLLDVRMPDMDGVEVVDRLQKMNCSLPVIVITAHEEERARFLNTVAFRLKPMNDNDLLTDIRTAVRLSLK
jgi:FixJ family two-component response regulator